MPSLYRKITGRSFKSSQSNANVDDLTDSNAGEQETKTAPKASIQDHPSLRNVPEGTLDHHELNERMTLREREIVAQFKIALRVIISANLS